MFSLLKKKFKISITLIIMILLLIPIIFLYTSFKISLEHDYDKNSEKFHSQMSQIFDMKISHIENSVNMFIFKYQLGNVLTYTGDSNFSNNMLLNISSYCPDISYACIFDKDSNIRYMNNSVLSKCFTETIKNGSVDYFSKKSTWRSMYLEEKYNTKKLYWIYICPISSSDGDICGYAASFIENNSFADIFEQFNTDYCLNNSFYICSNRENDTNLAEILSGFHKKDASAIKNAVMSGGSLDVGKKKLRSYNLKPGELRFVTIYKNDYILSILKEFLLILAVAWIIMLFASLFISSEITNQFVGDLENLCVKVNNFTKSKKNGGQENDKSYDCR